jgi:putative RecB family exonuclease
MESVSVSQVQAYLACPLKYRFQYVDRIPPPWRAAALAFGSSIHAAIEWFQRERLAGRDPQLEDMVAIFEADWYAANLGSVVFGDRESEGVLREKGVELLRLYVTDTDTSKPTRIEERFEIDLVDPETGEVFDLRLHGYIDLEEEDETLVELKTAARTLEQGGLERHLQLSTYALVYFLREGRIPKLRLDQLVKTKVPRLERHPTTRTIEDLAWTARLIAGTAKAIEARHFYPNPSWRCAECEFFAHCQKWQGE